MEEPEHPSIRLNFYEELLFGNVNYLKDYKHSSFSSISFLYQSCIYVIKHCGFSDY